MKLVEKEELCVLLCALGDAIQHYVISQKQVRDMEALSNISSVTASDTIYSIDKISEEALLDWCNLHWPKHLAVELVAEGLEENGPVVFPAEVSLEFTRYKLIIDPIDGTRELMYDKRSAWLLVGIAEQNFDSTCLSDIEVAMMTELPPSKQRMADQISGFRGCGRSGLISERVNLDSGERWPISIRPSGAQDLKHGVSSFVKFFSEGKEMITRIETELWQALGLLGHKSPVVFDDQYISTGGQMYGLMCGHYRFFADIRPEVLNSIGLGHSLCCHPYDVAAGLLLKEAGCVYESPIGGEVKAPLDTMTPVSWVGYASKEIAELVRPHLLMLMKKYF